MKRYCISKDICNYNKIRYNEYTDGVTYETGMFITAWTPNYKPIELYNYTRYVEVNRFGNVSRVWVHNLNKSYCIYLTVNGDYSFEICRDCDGYGLEYRHNYLTLREAVKMLYSAKARD